MRKRPNDVEKLDQISQSINPDGKGNLTVGKDLKVDGKLKLKSLVSASNPDGDITKELGGGGGGGGGGEAKKLYKHSVYVSGNYGKFEITFYNYNDVAIKSETKLITAMQSIGEIIATGYIKNGSSVYNVYSVYFQSSNQTVRAVGYKVDPNSGEGVITIEWVLDYSFKYTDNVSVVS